MIGHKIELLVLTLTLMLGLLGNQTRAGQGMSSMLMHEDNHALLPWRDFENSYNILFATEGPAQTPGSTREFIQVTMQQIPQYTRNTLLPKEEIELRMGTSKLVTLLNEIPEIGKKTSEGRKECKLDELSQRIVFEAIFAPNVHINTFLKYYNSLFFQFCINEIDRDIIRLTASKSLLLPEKFDDMKKAQTQAAKDLPGAAEVAQFARGLTLYLKSNAHNVDRADDRAAHLQEIKELVEEEVLTAFKCKEVRELYGLLLKYKLVSSLKNELSHDSIKWIDVIDLCDKARNVGDQLVLVDLYEIEAARLSTIIFMAANNPDFQHHDPAETEDDLGLIIDVLNAKKRLYREDHRVSLSKLEEVKFTLTEQGELCNLINLKKLQQLLAEYAGFPNVANYLLYKARMVSEKCKHQVHDEIGEQAEKLKASDVERLTSLRLRIADAVDADHKERMHNFITIESFTEGTLAFLLSHVYTKKDGFDIIARHLVAKTPGEWQTTREGAYMLLGEFCDEVESRFAKIRELFIEFDKLGDDSRTFDDNDRDWMANVNICSMIKFGTIQ